MTHPLTPPPPWRMDAWQARVETIGADVPTIFLEIAQWGWDQREPKIQADVDAELEACCEWLSVASNHGLGWDLATILSGKLRAARRPKPLSLKEQALEMLESAWEGGHINNNTAQTIRRALEALPDDQH